MDDGTRVEDSDRTRAKPPTFGGVIVRSVASPVNLSVAAAAAAGAALVHSWPLLALGSAAYAALVAWDLVSPEFWRKALTPTSAKVSIAQLGDLKNVRDPALRHSAQAIVTARGEFEQLYRGASPDVAAQLATVRASLDELERRAVDLIRAGDRLVGYMSRSDRVAVNREIERLTARARQTSDPEARSQYEQSVVARQEQVTALDEIARATERVYANLSRIVATLEGLSAKVVRMGVLDAQAMDNLSGDMNAELASMNQDIDTFEQTLRHLVAMEAPAR